MNALAAKQRASSGEAFSTKGNPLPRVCYCESCGVGECHGERRQAVACRGEVAFLSGRNAVRIKLPEGDRILVATLEARESTM